MKNILFAALLLPFCLCSAEKILVDQPQETFIYLRSDKTWDIPPWDGKGRVVVQFEQRLDFPRLGGWAPCWQISVNNRYISSMATRNQQRLLNKALTANHMDYGTSNVCAGEKWYALYSPDYEQAISRFYPANPEAYKISLDISDMLSRTSSNQIRIRFGSELDGYYRNLGLKRKPSLAVRNFRIVQEDIPTVLTPEAPEPDFVRMKEVRKPDYKLTQDSALTLTFGGTTCKIMSVFSIPGGKSCSMDKSGKISNEYYTVSRKIVKQSNRIDIFDTFTSKSDKLIGVKIAYEMDSAPFSRIYLAGDSSPSRPANEDGRNPSVFCSDTVNRTGIGLLAQDDVFRVQNIQYCLNGKTGLKTETFALSPGETRTVEWSVYPVMSEDYFDFVNEVRRDWDVNFTIPGGFHLSMNVFKDWAKNPEKAVLFHQNAGIRMNAQGVHYWRHLGPEYKDWHSAVFGAALLQEQSRVNIAGKMEIKPVEPVREFLRTNLALSKQIVPDVKRFVYFHTQWTTEIDDHKKYPDAILRKADGTAWIQEPYHFFVPTAENDFGKTLLQAIDDACKQFDLDGIYIDEMNSSLSRKAYGMWDKVSVELDKNNNVVRKIGFVPLLKLDFTMKMLELITVKNKKMAVGNFCPETRSERKYKFPRFEETYNSWWVFLSHLYTPVQLGDVLIYGSTPRDNMADIRNAMKHGALYYHYNNQSACPTITQKMYPFTPVELHSRWLLGKERILTCISGEFGWPGSSRLAEIFVYDENGKQTSDYSAEAFAEGKDTRIRLKLKPLQCAVLIAIPLEARLSGDVVIRDMHWENGKFRCQAAGTGTVELKKGTEKKSFSVKDTLEITL